MNRVNWKLTRANVLPAHSPNFSRQSARFHKKGHVPRAKRSDLRVRRSNQIYRSLMTRLVRAFAPFVPSRHLASRGVEKHRKIVGKNVTMANLCDGRSLGAYYRDVRPMRLEGKNWERNERVGMEFFGPKFRRQVSRWDWHFMIPDVLDFTCFPSSVSPFWSFASLGGWRTKSNETAGVTYFLTLLVVSKISLESIATSNVSVRSEKFENGIWEIDVCDFGNEIWKTFLKRIFEDSSWWILGMELNFEAFLLYCII